MSLLSIFLTLVNKPESAFSVLLSFSFSELFAAQRELSDYCPQWQSTSITSTCLCAFSLLLCVHACPPALDMHKQVWLFCLYQSCKFQGKPFFSSSWPDWLSQSKHQARLYDLTASLCVLFVMICHSSLTFFVNFQLWHSLWNLLLLFLKKVICEVSTFATPQLEPLSFPECLCCSLIICPLLHAWHLTGRARL